MMDRREFFKKAAAFGVTGAAALLLNKGPGGRLFAEPAAGTGARKGADIIAVKGGSQFSRLDRALLELGGIGAFVRRGQTVVIKPNIGWAQEPRIAANTSPELVKRLIEQCLQAGAKKVWVFDHSCDYGPTAYKTSLIESYAKDAGATVVGAHNSSGYQKVPIPNADVLKETEIFELVLEADVFINVPVLKNHMGAGMTCAMKNLMGIVWDRSEFHRRGLDRCIADSCLYRKPDLNIVDADRVMLSGGPRGYASSRYSEQNMLIASTDIVGIDAASAKTLGQEPERFGYIKGGEDRGLGIADLSLHDIKRIAL